jgi:hypothetical protein
MGRRHVDVNLSIKTKKAAIQAAFFVMYISRLPNRLVVVVMVMNLFGITSMMMIMAAVFEFPNHNRKKQTNSQSCGQFDAIMLVKLQFRQEINRGNTQEGPCGKGQGVTQHLMITA